MSKRKICDVIRSSARLMLSILPVVFWSCLIYSFDEKAGADITVIAIVIHEFGHLAFIYFATGKFQKTKGAFNGLRINGQAWQSYAHQILQYASGALANIFASLAIQLLIPFDNEYTKLFVTINIATAISNLLPIDGYDGYKILIALIDSFGLGYKAFWVLEAISFSFTALMCIFSLFLVYTFGNGYWFMAIFIFATINKLQKWQKYTNSRI